MSTDRHIGGEGARPQKEDLLRTLLCLTISATARQKPSGSKHWLAEVPRRYCVLLVPTQNAPQKPGAKTGPKPPKRAYFAPYMSTPKWSRDVKSLTLLMKTSLLFSSTPIDSDMSLRNNLSGGGVLQCHRQYSLFINSPINSG